MIIQNYLPAKLLTWLEGPVLLCIHSVVGAGMCLLLCLSWECLKDGLCSQIDLALSLLLVFRSSVFGLLPPKLGGYV